MITTNSQLGKSFPHLADVFVENSVYFKWLIKHRLVLFNSS